MKDTLKQIKLNAEDVCEFVAVANLCEFSIQLASDHCKVDAKRLEDMVMLDFSHLYKVIYHGYDRIFERYLSRVAAS